MIRNIVVGILTTLQAGRSTNHGSIPIKGKGLFSKSFRPAQGPRGLPPGGKSCRYVKLAIDHLVPTPKKRAAIPPFPPCASRRG